ncbi:MAG: TatD family hydrolase [Alistipes sp.]|nr:TatD family hydrolase [Alistipes sp.]
MSPVFVNIHTHRPTGRGIELRTAGIHPWEAGQLSPGQAVQELSAALDRGDAQAVGEIGLDFARTRTPQLRDAQTALFRAQLDLAGRRRLPVVLHCVKAFEETLRILGRLEFPAVIFHGFIGSARQARQALDRGYFLSFGERTFASPRTVEALRSTPPSQLFLETDDSTAPIEEIYTRIAALLSTDVETLRQITIANYLRIFPEYHG